MIKLEGYSRLIRDENNDLVLVSYVRDETGTGSVKIDRIRFFELIENMLRGQGEKATASIDKLICDLLQLRDCLPLTKEKP